MFELKTFVPIEPNEARLMIEVTGSRLKFSAFFSGRITNRFAGAPSWI
jgi:hypothetical protein